MDTRDTDSTMVGPGGDPAADRKKPYSAPRIELLGDVAELTQYDLSIRV